MTFSSPAHYCHPHSILLALSLSHRLLTADKKLTQIIRGHSLPGAAEEMVISQKCFNLSLNISIFAVVTVNCKDVSYIIKKRQASFIKLWVPPAHVAPPPVTMCGPQSSDHTGTGAGAGVRKQRHGGKLRSPGPRQPIRSKYWGMVTNQRPVLCHVMCISQSEAKKQTKLVKYPPIGGGNVLR